MVMFLDDCCDLLQSPEHGRILRMKASGFRRSCQVRILNMSSKESLLGCTTTDRESYIKSSRNIPFTKLPDQVESVVLCSVGTQAC